MLRHNWEKQSNKKGKDVAMEVTGKKVLHCHSQLWTLHQVNLINMLILSSHKPEDMKRLKWTPIIPE